MNYPQEILAIEALIGEKLADASEITPQEIRESFSAILNFVKKTSPLAVGTYTIGDFGTDSLRTVNLPYDVGTSDYFVVGSLISKSSNFNQDNDVIEMIKNKTATSFKLCLREVSSDVQNLDYDWAIYPKN